MDFRFFLSSQLVLRTGPHVSKGTWHLCGTTTKSASLGCWLRNSPWLRWKWMGSMIFVGWCQSHQWTNIVDMNWTTRNDTSQHLRQTAFVVSTDTTQSLPDPGNELACPLPLLVLLSDVGPMKSKRLKKERWSIHAVSKMSRMSFGQAFAALHFAILNLLKSLLKWSLQVKHPTPRSCFTTPWQADGYII